jgi:hypothetical protein
MTDYAARLLGGSQSEAAPPPTTDYASQLLGGKTHEPSVMRPVEEESRGAPFGTMVKSAMVDNPETKMRIYAKSRFPKLAEKDALDRYGVIGGEIVYLDDDGKIKKESPSGVGGFFKELGANLLGQAPAVVGGTAGAIMGAPAGPVGAAGGAALGAAGGKGYSQVIANLLFDEPQSPGGNVGGMATEGAVSGGTTFLGSKLAQKIGERALARDISKLNRPDAEALIAKAKGMGVDLNVAQATNLPSLKGRYEVLGRMEPSMDIIDASRVAQGEQAAGAAGKFLDFLSPSSASPQVAGQGARAGAVKVLDKVATNRATAAKPLYDKALSAVVDPADETLQRISSTPAFKQAWERAQRIAANEGIDLGDAANNMRALHYVKLGMDDLIKSGPREGVGATENRAIVGVKNQLLGWMDKAAPDYARARSVYGHYMPTLNAQRNGLMGELAELADTDVNTAARKIFDPRNAPEDVRNLRSMFFRYDQGAKWNAVLKSYLQDTLEQSSREFKSGAGGIRAQAPTWRAMIVGNPKQYEVLRAGMTAPQVAALNDMMEVFEAMGRVTGQGGSPTAPLQFARDAMRRDVGPGPIGVVSTAMSPQTWGPRIDAWLTEARLGKHAEEMARVMTSADGLNKLKQLRQMSSTDKRFVAGFASLFGIGKETDETPEDKPITRLSRESAAGGRP